MPNIMQFSPNTRLFKQNNFFTKQFLTKYKIHAYNTSGMKHQNQIIEQALQIPVKE